MDFKKILSTLDSMEARVATPAAPTLPKSAQLNEDAQLRVLAGQTSVLAEAELMEKAKSKAQQKAAGAALAAKRGEGTAKGASKEMSKMGTKDLKKFAGTKHKGLPEKKDESVSEAAIDDYLDKKKTEKGDDSGRRQHKGSRYGGSSQKDDAEDDKAETKKGRKTAKESVELDVEEFNETFSHMVEAAKKGSKPDFLDVDKDGDKKEPMKKAVADKKKGAIGKKKVDEAQLDELSSDTLQSYKKKTDKGMYKSVDPTLKGKEKDDAVRKDRTRRVGRDSADSKLIKKSLGGAFEGQQKSKKTVKESVEPKLTFKQMVQMVRESGGQQQIDAKDQELFSWAQRVAKSKLGEGMKAEVYAGLVYERMGGRFEMYDILSEEKK